jgi:hypothetical protein
MQNKTLKFISILFGITIFFYLGCYLNTTQGDSMGKNNNQSKKIYKNNINPGTIQKEFTHLYSQWQEYIQQPEVKISSRSKDYINCNPFKGIIKLGKPVLPYLIQKMKEGKMSS